MNYYNEFDPKTAAWLKELIKHGHIPDGTVDERSIADVRPDDLQGFTQCHFFAGIGGWPYALSIAGWPSDIPVWTGSCPCQPFSAAGKQRGTDDERHLWPEFFRLIRECQPPVVFGEQVASKAALPWLDIVFDDLEGEDYACGAADLCAASVKAKHIRQRLWWVADSKRSLWEEGQRAWSGGVGRVGRFRQSFSWDRTCQRALSEFRALDDGVSSDGVVVCCGARNAIVPQVAAEFIQAFVEVKGSQ